MTADKEAIKIFHLKYDSWDHFYYNPTTCQGVIIYRKDMNIKPVVVGMKREYNQDAKTYGTKMFVKQESFNELISAATDRNEELVNEVILQHFQKTTAKSGRIA